MMLLSLKITQWTWGLLMGVKIWLMQLRMLVPMNWSRFWNQPDWRSSLNAAVHWYNHHPQVHQDDIFERDQIIAVLTQKAEREAAQGPGG